MKETWEIILEHLEEFEKGRSPDVEQLGHLQQSKIAIINKCFFQGKKKFLNWGDLEMGRGGS